MCCVDVLTTLALAVVPATLTLEAATLAGRMVEFQGGRDASAIAGGRERRTREAGRTVTSSEARRRCPNFALPPAPPVPPTILLRRSARSAEWSLAAATSRARSRSYAADAAVARSIEARARNVGGRGTERIRPVARGFGRASPRNAKDMMLTRSLRPSSYVVTDAGRRRGASLVVAPGPLGDSSPVLSGIMPSRGGVDASARSCSTRRTGFSTTRRGGGALSSCQSYTLMNCELD